VTTEDGYILSLQRIPKGLSDNATDERRPPVLLQHGVLMVSSFLLPPLRSQPLPSNDQLASPG